MVRRGGHGRSTLHACSPTLAIGKRCPGAAPPHQPLHPHYPHNTALHTAFPWYPQISNIPLQFTLLLCSLGVLATHSVSLLPSCLVCGFSRNANALPEAVCSNPKDMGGQGPVVIV